MAKMSRMAKYKDLREGIKTDVVTSDSASVYTKNEEVVRDADYYKNIVSSDQATQLESIGTEDTLMESITLDTINSQVDEELERALSRVREEAGQEDFNTRMDILNKIRQTKMAQEAAVADEEELEEVEDEDIEEDDEDEEEDTRRRFGLFKRHQDDDDDDEEEYEEDEEDDDDEQPRKRFGLFKRHQDDDDDDDEYEEIEEDDEEENSKFIKVLNGIIVVLGLVLVALLGYIVKEFIF